MIRSLYLHVPFCTSICRYCAFARTADLSKTSLWLQAVSAQVRPLLESLHAKEKSFRFETLYFGGGTPGALACSELEKLCSLFTGSVDEDTEWTVEVNPESINLEKALLLKKMGVNRISIGLQSFDDSTLQKMGRRHTAEQGIEAVGLLRKAGFENISADLIVACPWQTEEDIRADLRQLAALSLPHVSVYTLILEENSAFGKTGLEPLDEETEAEAYELAVSLLKQAGYDHYEISSFARDGRYSRHNLAYWQDQPYYAIGYGAAGREENGKTYHHEGTLQNYLENGYQYCEDEDQDPAFNALMMGLRTRFGIRVSDWNTRYGKDLLADYAAVWKKYEAFLQVENGFLFLNEAGREILDSVLLDLLMTD